MVILQLLQPASASTRRSTALMRVSLTLVRAWIPARMRRQSSRRTCGIRRMLEAAGHLREKTHGAVMVCPRRRRSSLQNLLVHRHFHHECCIYNYNFLNMSHFQTPGGDRTVKLLEVYENYPIKFATPNSILRELEFGSDDFTELETDGHWVWGFWVWGEGGRQQLARVNCIYETPGPEWYIYIL